MVNVRVPPYTGNEELDVYLRDLTDLLEEFELTAVTAGVTTSNALEENLESGTIVVGGDIYGYRYNNLAIRYSSSANGAENFSDSIAVLPPTTTTFYVGLRSTPDAVESNNPADYTWVQASPTWNINLRLYYRVTGGKQFDYVIASTNPNPQAYVEDTGEFVNLSLVTAVEMIELTGGRGADGVDGTDGRSTANLSIYQRATSAPSTPTGGSYDFSTNTITAPTGWSSSIPSGDDDLYVSQAIANIEGSDGTDSDLTWSSPELFVASVINGADGFSLFQATIYQRGTSTPSTPTGGSYNFGTNTLTAPTGWSDDIPSGSNPVYRSTGLFEVQGNTGTDSTVTWTAPKLFVQDGSKGDAGDDGTSTYRANIYIQQSTAPSTPSGGSFNFTTNTLTVPTGWVEDLPALSVTPTYISTGLFSISGDEGTDNTVTWSSPVRFTQQGENALLYTSLNYDDLLATVMTAGATRALSAWTGPSNLAGDYTFIKSGSDSTFTISDSGILNDSDTDIETLAYSVGDNDTDVNSDVNWIIFAHPDEDNVNSAFDSEALATMRVGTQITYTDINNNNVVFRVESVGSGTDDDGIVYLLNVSHIEGQGDAIVTDNNDVVFQINSQLRGEKGDGGENGTDATRSTTGLVYYTIASSTAPATPSATSYNFSTGTFTGLTGNWQTTPVEVNITNTTDLYWRSRYLITEATLGGSQTITFTTPTGSINFGNDIQSDNFVADSAGWQIQRDTGNAEFSNVTIRGESTVNSTSIGGDGVVEGVVNSASLSINADTEDARLGVITNVDSVTINAINFTISLAANDGVNAEEVLPQGGSVSNNFVMKVVDISTGTVIDSEAVTSTVLLSEFSLANNNTDFWTRFTYDEEGFNLSVDNLDPDKVYALDFDVDLNSTNGTNWTFSRLTGFSFGGNDVVGSISKPTDTSAFITSEDATDYSLSVLGGEGLKVNSTLIIKGGVSGFFGFGSDVDGLMYVVVEYDSDGETKIATVVVGVPPGNDGYLINEYGVSNVSTDFTATEVRDGKTGNRVGSIYAVGRHMGINDDNNHSSISNVIIREVWRKMA